MAALCWSTVATAFKLSLLYFTPAGLLFIAVVVSLVFLSISMLFRDEKHIDLSPKMLLRSAILGFLNPFLYYTILFKAYSLLPAQTALSLNYTWAIVVVLLSIPLLKQRVRFMDIAGLLLSFTGVVVIVTNGNIFSFKITNTYGVILALSSSLIWALFWIFNVRDKRDELNKLFLNFVFGFIYIFIYMLVNGEVELLIKSIKLLSVVAGAYVGLFEMGISFVFWLKALQYSESTSAVSNIIYISPFFSLFIISIILGEHIFFASIVGLIMIIAGIVLRTLKKNN